MNKEVNIEGLAEYYEMLSAIGQDDEYVLNDGNESEN